MSAREETKSFRDALALRRAIHLATKAVTQLEYADDALLATSGEFAPQSQWVESVILEVESVLEGLNLLSKEYPL